MLSKYAWKSQTNFFNSFSPINNWNIIFIYHKGKSDVLVWFPLEKKKKKKITTKNRAKYESLINEWKL